MKDTFSERLLDWHKENPRPLPWKVRKDAYAIWLSEIILQQTRVEQGTSYYLKFVEHFPTIQDLAAASQDEVFKLWEGLGYYSRARNLHVTAQFISTELDGQFPTTHDAILQLKGVGPYTAAAIASFAYNLPHAVVDGNVYRVLSRIFGIATPIDTTAGKKEFTQLAQSLLDKEKAGAYNQAIMNFGATHCAPRKPKCRTCPFRQDCKAHQENAIDRYPLKSKKIKKRTRYFHYLLLNNEDSIWIEKREAKDIWRDLYQFPMIEHTVLLEDKVALEEILPEWLKDMDWKVLKQSPPYRQLLTHQEIIANFWELSISKKLTGIENNYTFIQRSDTRKYPYPKIIDRYLNDQNLYLF
ncbi:MAG: A/G-specific adenine glycosylase [Bacteroidota bacterium]